MGGSWLSVILPLSCSPIPVWSGLSQLKEGYHARDDYAKDHHHDARDQKRIANRIFMRREPRYVLRGVPRLAEEFTNELLPKGHAETENGKDKTYTIDNQNICRHPLISHRASINSLLANTGLARNLPRHGQHAARP